MASYLKPNYIKPSYLEQNYPEQSYVGQSESVDDALLMDKSRISTSWGIGERHQVREIIKLAGETVKLWYARYRQRQQLSQLAEFALKDIGITRVDALKEAGKPFWKK